LTIILPIVHLPFTQIQPHRVRRNGKYLYLYVKINSFNYYSGVLADHSIQFAMRQVPKFISDIYFLTLLINVAGHSKETENKQENYMENSRNLLTKSETATNWRRRPLVFPPKSPRNRLCPAKRPL